MLRIFLLYLILPEVMLRPPSSSSLKKGRRSRTYDKTLEEYLTQFGYLPASGAHSMRTYHQLENAVKNLQFYAGLNVTGFIDDATVDLITKYVFSITKIPNPITYFNIMIRPRCGVPDVSQIGYRNRRDVTSSFRVVHRRRRGRDHRRLQHRKHHRRIRRYNIQGKVKSVNILAILACILNPDEKSDTNFFLLRNF